MIALSPAQRDETCDILKRIVPHARVAIFGSRATGTTKPFSDLDLMIFNNEELSIQTIGLLRDAFSASSLPFRVDIVDAAIASEEFLATITPDMVTLQEAM